MEGSNFVWSASELYYMYATNRKVAGSSRDKVNNFFIIPFECSSEVICASVLVKYFVRLI
jgi:hypothetical protein